MLLSPREREVLSLVAEGMTEREIAARLVVSPHTVHRHMANIRANAVIRRGLTTPLDDARAAEWLALL